MAKKKPEPAQPTSAADRIDRSLAASALEKQRRGEQPSTKELSALRRVEKAAEEERRWQYYATIPKKHWVMMSGRSVQVLNEQATRYGLPLDGRTIDLPKLARGLHDFLASNARLLASKGVDDPLMAGGESDQLERYRAARADLAEMELARQRCQMLPVEEVHRGLSVMAGILRRCGEQLARHYGDGARGLLDRALDAAQRVMDGWLAGAPDDSDNGTDAETVVQSPDT